MASPGESGPALAVAARICGMTGGVLRLVHVRTCDPQVMRKATCPVLAVPLANRERRP